MSKYDNDSKAGLYAWIKKDQQEREQHAMNMTMRAQEEDKQLYHKMIDGLRGMKLKQKEAIFVNNLSDWRDKGYVLSPAQRSALTNLFYNKLGK